MHLKQLALMCHKLQRLEQMARYRCLDGTYNMQMRRYHGQQKHVNKLNSSLSAHYAQMDALWSEIMDHINLTLIHI